MDGVLYLCVAKYLVYIIHDNKINESYLYSKESI